MAKMIMMAVGVVVVGFLALAILGSVLGFIGTLIKLALVLVVGYVIVRIGYGVLTHRPS